MNENVIGKEVVDADVQEHTEEAVGCAVKEAPLPMNRSVKGPPFPDPLLLWVGRRGRGGALIGFMVSMHAKNRKEAFHEAGKQRTLSLNPTQPLSAWRGEGGTRVDSL